MNKCKFLFIALVVLNSCRKSSDPLQFIPLKQFNYADRIKGNNGPVDLKTDNYIVKGFNDDKTTEAAIDRFAKGLKNRDFDTVENYQIAFYKYSSNTNLKHLKENPRDFDRESQDDRILVYFWSNGKFINRMKYKDGVVVGGDDIKIEYL